MHFKSNLNEPLIMNHLDIPFQITKDDLIYLLDPDRVNSQISHHLIEEKGGIENLFNNLNVNPEVGLPEDRLLFHARKQHFGENTPIVNQAKSLLHCFCLIFKEKFIIFLIAASALRLAMDIYKESSRWFDVVAIYLVVVFLALINGLTEFLKDRVFHEFNKDLVNKNVRVLRAGSEKLIPSSELLVGDILIITAGDKLTVDGIIIKAHSVEMEYIDKKLYSNIDYSKKWFGPYFRNIASNFPFVFSESRVSKGFAFVLVLAVGLNVSSKRLSKSTKLSYKKLYSQLLDRTKTNSYSSPSPTNMEKRDSGIIFKSNDYDSKASKSPNKRVNQGISLSQVSREHSSSIKPEVVESPLQRNIAEIIGKFTRISFTVTLLILILLICRYLTAEQTTHSLAFIIVDDILYCIVVLILVIPEGLNLALMLSITFSIRKMTQEGTMIKNFESYENMACCNVICTDYFGILTKNEVNVMTIFIEDKTIKQQYLSGIREVISDDLYDFLCESISVNTTAFRAHSNVGIKQFVGYPAECALIKFLTFIGENYHMHRNNPLRPIIDCSANTPDGKINFTIIEMSEKADKVRLYVMGSFESLIDYVTVYIEHRKTPVQFLPKHHEKLKNILQSQIKQGCNSSIMICYRDIPIEYYNQLRSAYSNKEGDYFVNLIRQLSFIALVGLKDELKLDVQQYINDCSKAGISVRMLTSQDKDSARTAATECGIIKRNFLSEENMEILDAEDDLRSFIHSDLKARREFQSNLSADVNIHDVNRLYKVVKDLRVVSRARSKDKFLLVRCLIDMGNIVAVTGDCVSDALAMDTAHVGISMGNKTSDQSKEASDIIMKEDNFSSIITAVIYSRNMYDNVRRFLQFNITCTATLLIIITFSSIPHMQFAFYPNKLLLLNIIINSLNAIALASANPNRGVLINKKPYKRNSSLITPEIKARVVVQTVIQCSILVSVFLLENPIRNVLSEVQFGLAVVDQSDVKHIFRTFVFEILLLMQVFNAFISRSIDGIHFLANISNDWVFMSIQCFILIVHFVSVQFGEKLVRNYKMHWKIHLICLALSSLALITVPVLYLLRSRIHAKEEEYLETENQQNPIKSPIGTIARIRSKTEITPNVKFD